jgi:60S ribosome subunit biogenesis protein NIP7|eukprot:gene917-972_t
MRPLNDEEMRLFFEKLQLYIGNNIQKLIDRKDEIYTFRLMKDRVYYISEKQLKLSSNVQRDSLLSIGTCFGKFTKSHHKFHLNITCLDYLSQYSLYKVWIKSGAEMSFLYGNHVTKTMLAKITENTPQYAGVIVYNSQNIPLGFGIAAQPTEYCGDLDPTGIVVLHQSDIGEYLRVEDSLF